MTRVLDPDSSMWDNVAVELRQHRISHGMSLAQVAMVLKVDRRTVSSWEVGRNKISETDARVLDDHWQTGGRLARLVRYARRAHDPNWQREHASFEQKSSSIWLFEGLRIAGLLQTPEYARAMFLMHGHTDVDDLVEERIRRQDILSGTDPAELWALLDEVALLRPVGSDEEMAQQLEHLVRSSERPNISVRVVPLTARSHLGQEGSFKLMQIRGGRPKVGYVEAPTGGRLMEDPEGVCRLSGWYDRISAKALPEDLSSGLIRRRMEEMS